MLFLVLLFVVCLPLPCSTEDSDVEYKLKAELMERFTRFIEWPGDVSGSNASSPFIVAVVGKNPFGSYLNQVYQNVRIKGKPVEVNELSDVSKIERCQMIFISNSEEKNLFRILLQTEKKPILTVADTEGFAQKGVLINFYREGDYIRFEVNQSAADRSGLKFSSRLLKLAKLVEPK